MAELTDLAARCAGRLNTSADTFDDALRPCDHEFRELLLAIRDTHVRYAFDHDGRPAALRAVREALPLMEAEILDAVLEDLACELAAVQEAWYRLATARTQSSGQPAPARDQAADSHAGERRDR